MIDETEFSDVAEALTRYRPVAPAAAKAAAIASTLQPRSRWRWPAAIAAVVLTGVALWAWQTSHQPPAPVPAPTTAFSTARPYSPFSDISPEFSEAWFKQARQVLPTSTQTKPVMVTVFIDWQCLGCFVLDQNLIRVIEQLERRFPGRITVVFEDWPWDPSCNSALSTDAFKHGGSCELARAVRSARERGLERELINWLRDHQTTWRNTGLPQEFRISPTEGEAALQDSIARGQLLKINATPTTFINGVRISEIMSSQHLEWAIRLELARATAKSR